MVSVFKTLIRRYCVLLLFVALCFPLGCNQLSKFEVISLDIKPEDARVGDKLDVNISVKNRGIIEGTYTAILAIEGDADQRKDIKIFPGTTGGVTFSLVKAVPGKYKFSSGDISKSIEIKDKTATLEELRVYNPAVYYELLKLPELKEIDVKTRKAIGQVAYTAMQEKYKTVYEVMLNEGIKDRRKYCTPLQALLWIAYDRDIVNGAEFLKNYSLEYLINYAWNHTYTSFRYTSDRWKNFDEVTDRLNSPGLIALYLRDNFTWTYDKSVGDRPQSASEFFSSNCRGPCFDHAVFSGYCLKMNGYEKVQGLAVNFDRSSRWDSFFRGHIVCIFQQPMGISYFIDNSHDEKGSNASSVYGPFANVEDVAKLACLHGSGLPANLKRYSLHDIDLATGRFKTKWYLE